MRISLSIFVFVFLISCRKDKCEFFKDIGSSYDTILPHPYFPAYPGSYWIFNDTSLNSIIVEPDWEPFKLIEYHNNHGCEWLKTDMVMLPKIQSEYLNYDRLHTYENEQYIGTNILFSDELNWHSYTDPEYFYPSDPDMFYQFPDKYKFKRKRIDILTDVEFNSWLFDSVMVIQEDQYITGGLLDHYLIYTNIYYYAKDVGPIRIEKYEFSQYEPTDTAIFTLTDYFINN